MSRSVIKDQIEKANRLSQVDFDLAKVISTSGLKDGDTEDDKVQVKKATVKSSDLGPSQTTMRIDDALGAALEMLNRGAPNPVEVGAIISADNRIMDGHHRWAASILAFGKNAKIKGWKSDIPGQDLVKVLNILTKGKFGRQKGNQGTASIKDVSPKRVKEQLEKYRTIGRSHPLFSFSPEEFKVLMESNFGSLENGIDMISERADLIKKTVPSWAPDRIEMPVIENEEVPMVSDLLGKGLLDWKTPFSDVSPIIKGSSTENAMSSDASVKRVVANWEESKSPVRSKTAGIVQHVKDTGSDGKDWAFGPGAAQERDIRPSFEFSQKEIKPLLKTLRSCLVALGHVASAHNTFVKVKSRKISPDGQLGGKGYIQKIPDMRRNLMNTVEALSAFTDTLYDEVNAPHWNPELLSELEQQEVEEIKEDVQEIRESPEEFIEEQEESMEKAEEAEKVKKTASRSVKVEVVKDRVTGLWGVELNDTNITGDIFVDEKEAMREAQAVKSMAETGKYSVGDLAKQYYKYHGINRAASRVSRKFISKLSGE